ncbi:MAG: alkylation response protein AidB-like acyl-CoA dehydrogenase [Gammaproteobacteria bacterium]|jgi:alkylation response protein AidB-like acyl-CoA dehydrogenase
MISMNEDQRMIVESVRRFLREQFPFTRRQALTSSEMGFNHNDWIEFASLGWTGMSIADEYGGFGGSEIDSLLIYRELAESLVPGPFLQSVISACSIIQSVADKTTKQALLPSIADGSKMFSTAWFEDDDISNVQSQLDKKGQSYCLNGCKRLVPWGMQVDQVLLTAKLSDTVVLINLPIGAQGIDALNYRFYDGQRASDMSFNNVTVNPEWIIGPVTTDQVQSVIDLESAALCFESSALMWAIHDQTLAYMKTREQFGQTLSSMQALQHRIVDVYVDCQLAQSMAEDAVLAAVNSLDANDTATRISAARLFIADRGKRVGKAGIQLHGGIGITNDIPIGHYFKRLSAISLLNGNSHWHRQRFLDHS